MWPAFPNDADSGGSRLIDRILDVQIELSMEPDFLFGCPLWYLFERSRRVLMEARDKHGLGITTDILFDAGRVNSFSRYQLSFLYGRIAAHYRYLNLPTLTPPFFESESLAKSYARELWLVYYPLEVNDLVLNAVFSKSVVNIVLNCKSEDGICVPVNDYGREAISRSRKILDYRYGFESYSWNRSERSGFVYVLGNKHFKDNILKIGRTERDATVRAKELSRATGVPADFEVIYRVAVPDCHAVEQRVHELLSPKRASAGKEFFAVSLSEAQQAIQSAIRHLGNTQKVV